MNSKNDFYIGWQDKSSDYYSEFLKKIVPFIFLIVMLAALGFVFVQNGFSGGVFEFGKLTQLEGQLFLEPVPMLKVQNTEGAFGSEVYQSVLLIGFGKFGVESALKDLKNEAGKGTMIQATVEGTLIYSEGKALLELTNGEASILTADMLTNTEKSQEISALGNVSLKGEIIDPKCYFGVMKPGEGKVHRSCAVRCISGGIPPVLKVRHAEGNTEYYLLLGSDGGAINQEILEFVARSVRISGKLEKVDDWHTLSIDPKTDIQFLEEI